jgi:hypothetical protein
MFTSDTPESTTNEHPKVTTDASTKSPMMRQAGVKIV